MGTRGRPRKLSLELIEKLALNVELLDGSVEAGARASGIAPRSLRRWRKRGRDELAELSLEAQLVLALDRVEAAGRAMTWQEAVERLDAMSSERSGLTELDDLLADFADD